MVDPLIHSSYHCDNDDDYDDGGDDDGYNVSCMNNLVDDDTSNDFPAPRRWIRRKGECKGKSKSNEGSLPYPK